MSYIQDDHTTVMPSAGFRRPTAVVEVVLLLINNAAQVDALAKWVDQVSATTEPVTTACPSLLCLWARYK